MTSQESSAIKQGLNQHLLFYPTLYPHRERQTFDRPSDRKASRLGSLWNTIKTGLVYAYGSPFSALGLLRFPFCGDVLEVSTLRQSWAKSAAVVASLTPRPGVMPTYTLLVLTSEVSTQGCLSSAQACSSRALQGMGKQTV